MPQALLIGDVRIDPPVLMAPMAGFTDFAYRQIVRRFGGVGLPAVEMVSARGFLAIGARGERPHPRPLSQSERGESLPDRLWGVEHEPRPLAVQIWDNDPETLARVGARLAHELRATVVDVNFGCPAKEISQRAKSGSYLLRYPDRVGRLIASLVEACRPVPVTAKIRLGLTPSRRLLPNRRCRRSPPGDRPTAATVVRGRRCGPIWAR